MRAVMALAMVGLIGSACTTMDNLRPTERGEFLAVKDVSYERLWKAAHTVMARKFRIVESDSEIGVLKGKSGTQEHVWDHFFWRQSVALFIWPTESNDYGYTINIDAMPGPPLSFIDSLSVPVDPYVEGNWHKILLKELKKELGAS